MATKTKSFEESLIEKVHIEHIEWPDEIIFSVDSFTTPDQKYMVTANFKSGVTTCSCMDSVCRGKIMDFTDGRGYSCKHMRAAALVVRPFYEAALKGLLGSGSV